MNSPSKKFIRVKLPPMSLNQAFYRNRKYTTKARSYREEFLDQLQLDANQAVCRNIQKQFDQNKHYLHFSYIFLLPKSKLFTKKGYISHQSMDLDNCLKLTTDFICNKKYVERGYNNLNIDDKFICSHEATKRVSPTNEYEIHIAIEVRSLTSLV